MACAMAFPIPRIFCCLALRYAKTSLKPLSSTKRNSLVFYMVDWRFSIGVFLPIPGLKRWLLVPKSWGSLLVLEYFILKPTNYSKIIPCCSWSIMNLLWLFHQCHDQLTNDIFAKVSHNWSHWEQILPDGDALGNRSRQEYHFGGWNSCSLLDFYYSFLFLVQCILHSLKSTKSWFCDGVLYLAGHTRESGQKLMWKTLSESQQPNVVFFSGNLENSSPGCDKVILQERWIIVNEYWIRDWTRCNPWPCRANFSSFRLKHDVV